jgi:autotransporter-associated beta strand protein
VTFASAITGSGSLSKQGAGTLFLSVVNTYTGATFIGGGTVQLGVANTLPTATALTVNGGTLDLNGFNQQVASLSDGGVTTGGVTNGSGTAATLTVDQTTSTTFGGVVSGNLGLTKLGTGTLALTGANTYTGATTLSAGTIKLGVTNTLPTATALTVDGGNLDLNGNSQQVASLSDGGVTTGSTITNSSTTAAILTVSQTTSTTFGGVIGGDLGLTKLGTGTLALTGANTYTGATTISAGTVQTGVAGALPTATVLTVNGGTLDLAGNSQQVNSLSDGGVSTGIITNSSGTTATLDMNPAANSTYSGLISGNLGLSLAGLSGTGTGTFVLTGANTYTGPTILAGGTLLVANTSGSATGTGAITVDSGATLCGTGTVSGAVTIAASADMQHDPGFLTAGTIAFDSSGNFTNTGSNIGTLHTGSLTLAAGSSTTNGGAYQFKFNVGAGTADQVIVNGTAALNGGSYIVLRQLDSTRIPNNFVLPAITTSGGVTAPASSFNNFDPSAVNILDVGTANAAVTWTGAISANGLDYDLIATRATYASLATTANNRSIGGALDGDSRNLVNGSAMYTLLTDLDSLSSSQFNAALNAMSPEFYGGASDVSIKNVQRYNATLSDYLAQRRMGYPGAKIYSAGGLPDVGASLASATPDPAMLSYASVAADANGANAADAGAPMAEVSDSFRAFMEPMGMVGNRLGDIDRFGYSYNAYGVMTGADLKLSPEWIVGLAGSYLHSELNYNNGLGDVKIDSVRAGPFVGATFGRLLLDASVTVGYHWMDSDRNVNVPGFSSSLAQASYDAYDVSGYARAGYRLRLTRRTNLIPMASVDYTYFNNNNFAETGGNSATDLTVASNNISSLRSSVGLGLDTWVRIAGVKVVPEVSVAWIHEYLDDNKITATFADGVTPFTVESGSGKTDGVMAGAGFSVLFSRNISAFLRYSVDAVPKDMAHIFGVGMTIGF